MIFGIFHLFFVHLYILLVGRPQHYGPVFNHIISKLVLLEISVWVLGTLHGVYKARRSAPEPSQEGGWCGEEKVWTLGKQGGRSLFRGWPTRTSVVGFDVSPNVVDVKPMGCPWLGILWVGSFGVWWNFEMDFEKFQWICYLSPLWIQKSAVCNANPSMVNNLFVRPCFLEGWHWEGHPLIRWWLPWTNSRGRYLPSANLHVFKPIMTAVAPLFPKATCCSHFHSFHLYCPAPASGGAWSAGRKDTKLQGNPGDDMLKFISCLFSLWMTRDHNGGDGGEHDAGSFVRDFSVELRKAKLETMTLDKKRQIDSAAAFRPLTGGISEDFFGLSAGVFLFLEVVPRYVVCQGPTII